MTCVCSYLAHYTRIIAIYTKKPSELMIYNYFSVVYSIVLDLVLFGHELHWFTVCGMMLTSAGLLSNFVVTRKSHLINR